MHEIEKDRESERKKGSKSSAHPNWNSTMRAIPVNLFPVRMSAGQLSSFYAAINGWRCLGGRTGGVSGERNCSHCKWPEKCDTHFSHALSPVTCWTLVRNDCGITPTYPPIDEHRQHRVSSLGRRLSDMTQLCDLCNWKLCAKAAKAIMTQFVAVAVAVDKKNVAKWLGNCYCGRLQRTGNALSKLGLPIWSKELHFLAGMKSVAWVNNINCLSVMVIISLSFPSP